MITTLSALLATKYGKYVLEIVVVLGLVFGAYKWAEHRGAENQKATDQQQQNQELEASRKDAKDANQKLVQQATDAQHAAEGDAQLARQQFASLAQLLQNLSAKETAGHAQVAQVADSDLRADIISKLQLRKPGDQTACYTPVEERTLDEVVTQYPVCRQEKDALTGQVQQKQREVDDADKVVALKQQIIDGNNAYTALLEQDYKKLWDEHPPRFRSAGCLFLWKCGKRKVDLQLPQRK